MLDLAPISAWGGQLKGLSTPAVSVEAVEGAFLAHVAAFAGRAGDVQAILEADGAACSASGPQTWLLVAEGRPELVNDLKAVLGGLAAVVEQSGGQSLVRVRGPKAVELLMKGVFLDLEDPAFSAAWTVLAHINLALWRAGPDAFVLAVPRSYAGALAHWLSLNTAEYR